MWHFYHVTDSVEAPVRFGCTPITTIAERYRRGGWIEITEGHCPRCWQLNKQENQDD